MPKHSVADRRDPNDARLFAPAAARNAGPIVDALTPLMPTSGTALEVASGTGEHVVKLAEANPGLTWQPTDVDPQRLASIEAWRSHCGHANILPPIAFDAVAAPWSGPPADIVFLANLTHLITETEAERLLTHLAGAAAPNGTLAIYGPFKRDHGFASDGDERFDAAIRAERPDAGYKSVGWMTERLRAEGLNETTTLAMPANNLMLVWKR